MTLIFKNSKQLNSINLTITQTSFASYINLSSLYNSTKLFSHLNINDLITLTKLNLYFNTLNLSKQLIIGTPLLSNFKINSLLINKEHFNNSNLLQFKIQNIIKYTGLINNFYYQPKLNSNRLKDSYNIILPILNIMYNTKITNYSIFTVGKIQKKYITFLNRNLIKQVSILNSQNNITPKNKIFNVKMKHYFILNKANLKLFERIKK